MAAVAWKRGMATRCDACLSSDLEYAEDGVATCHVCGKRTVPYWADQAARAQAFPLAPGPSLASRQVVVPAARQAPKATGPPREVPPATVSRILVDSLRILPAVPVPLLGLFLGFGFAFEAAMVAVGGNATLNTAADPTRGGSILASLVGAVFLVVAFSFIAGTAVHFMLEHYRKKPAELRGSLKAARSVYPSMIGATLITAVIFGVLAFGIRFGLGLALVGSPVFAAIGSVAFVVALVVTIVLAIGLSLYPAAVIASHESAVSALGSSWRYTKGHRVALFLVFLVVAIPFVAVGFGLTATGVLSTVPLAAIVLSALLDAWVWLWGSAVAAVSWELVGPPPAA